MDARLAITVLLACNLVFDVSALHNLVGIAAWMFVLVNSMLALWVSSMVLNIHFNSRHNTDPEVVAIFQKANTPVSYFLDLMSIVIMGLLLMTNNYFDQAKVYAIFSTALLMLRMLCVI
jgi:hypothetical protein